ncbi:MAG: hypothetical protein ACR2OD_06765, partial [Gaiellaceae bacterium]
FAPVSIPVGATITAIRVLLTDGAVTDVSATLERASAGTGATLATATTSGMTTFQTVEVALATPELVDEGDYLWFEANLTSSTHRVCGAQIIYTLPGRSLL